MIFITNCKALILAPAPTPGRIRRLASGNAARICRCWISEILSFYLVLEQVNLLHYGYK